MPKLTRIKINETVEEKALRKGVYLVVIADEPCFTCGHRKRVIYPETSDGRTIVINNCLYCSVKHPTHANRNGP